MGQGFGSVICVSNTLVPWMTQQVDITGKQKIRSSHIGNLETEQESSECFGMGEPQKSPAWYNSGSGW
jgi:hypothetical protein